MRLLTSVLILALVAGALSSAQPAIARERTIPDRSSPPVSASTGSDPDFWEFWTHPVNVSQSSLHQAEWPTLGVTADGRTVYLAWHDVIPSSQDVYHATWTLGDPAWPTPQRVTDVGVSWRPNIVVAGTTPFIAWSAEDATGYRIYEMSLAGGSPQLLTPSPNDFAVGVRMAVSAGGELHLTSPGGTGKPDILYSRQDAGSTTWLDPTVVFTHTASGSFNPAIAASVDGQTVHLVWQEIVSKSEIFYMRGQRGGSDISWDTPTLLSTGAPPLTWSLRPAIALGSGSTIHAVWGERDLVAGVQYVRYSQSTDGGTSWSTPQRIDANPIDVNAAAPTDVAPALVVTPSGAVCAAWHGYYGAVEAEEIWVTCSIDDGASWGSLTNVSKSARIISIRPVMAVGTNGLLHVAWQEAISSLSSDYHEINYAHSVPYAVFLPIAVRNK